MIVELFTSGHCPACRQVEDTLARALDALGNPAEIRVVHHSLPEQIDRAVALGVKALPAIAIDGRLSLTGLPSTEQLQASLQRALS